MHTPCVVTVNTNCKQVAQLASSLGTVRTPHVCVGTGNWFFNIIMACWHGHSQSQFCTVSWW